MASSSSANVFRVDPASGHFLDSHGRVAILRGVNAVYKTFPFHPETEGFDYRSSLSAEDAKFIADLGFNVVRLGTMWPGVYPTRGKLNETYLATIQTILDNFDAQNVVAIIDAHQDLVTERFCGEGAPDWVVPLNSHSFPEPVTLRSWSTDATGMPLQTDCHSKNFGVFNMALETNQAVQAMWDNKDGFQDEFINFWRAVSKSLAEHPAVFAYELWNEPWPANLYIHPQDFLFSGKADKKYLQPMYERLHKAIRENDNSTIVLYEPAVTDYKVFGQAEGFTQGPGGPEFDDRQGVAYHVYCLAVNKTCDPISQSLCSLWDSSHMESFLRGARKLGGGSFLTEFGANDNMPSGVESVHVMANLADKHLQSWTWWMYKDFYDITTASYPGSAESFWDNEGNLQYDKVKALSRTYAQFTSGMPSHMSFDHETGAFQLVFMSDPSIKEPTQIFYNHEMHYPDGITVQISPSSAATYELSKCGRYVLVYNKGAESQEVTVALTRPEQAIIHS